MTTQEFIDWLTTAEDDVKMRFALNWRMPHSIFNVASDYHDVLELQDVNWYRVHKSRDLGKWSNGNKVIPQG